MSEERLISDWCELCGKSAGTCRCFKIDDDGWTEVGGGWVNLRTGEAIAKRACCCGGSVGDYEGPVRDCPVHGEFATAEHPVPTPEPRP